jgi:hypothetical protein
MPKEILIRGGDVITVDPTLGDFADADVLVRTASSLKSATTLLPRGLTRR